MSHKGFHTIVISGRAAANTLLKGGRKRTSTGKRKQYEKPGDYETAVKDFYSVDPKDVKSIRLSNGVGGYNN